MRRLARSHATWTAAGAVATYVGMGLVLPSETMRLLFTGLALGVAVVITVTWAGAAWRAFRSGGDTPEEQMIIAIFATWAAIVLGRAYAAVYYMLDAPAWLSQSHTSGFLAMVVCIAGYLFVTAPGTAKGAMEGRWKLHVALALIIGIAVAAFMIGISGGYTIGVASHSGGAE